MTQPLVSIFALTYNHENFIAEFIESVLSQTYKNWELIISDDFSKDKTPKILKIYQAKYPNKIKILLNKKNIGITNNTIQAISKCKGKYICGAGGDDIFLPQKIEKQVRVLENNPSCNICYHDLEVLYDGYSINFSRINQHTPPRGSLKDLIKYGSFMGACSVMFRRECLPPYIVDKRITIASDWLLFAEVLKGGIFLYIDEVLGKYRKHNNNITSTRTIECINDHILSCGILLSKYPQYAKEIRYRLSQILIEKYIYKKRMKDSTAANDLLGSMFFNLNIKNILLYLCDKLNIDITLLDKIKNTTLKLSLKKVKEK